MANLFGLARRAAQFSESRGAFQREAKRKEEVREAAKLAEKQAAIENATRTLPPGQQQRLRITQAFQQAYRRPALDVKATPRPQVERTVAFLKAIDSARASGKLKRRGIKAILER